MERSVAKPLRPFPTLTLVIVVSAALVLLGLGYPTHWIWKRQQFLNLPGVSGRDGYKTRAPWPLWMFGEPGVFAIDTPQQYEREAEELFPEIGLLNGKIHGEW